MARRDADFPEALGSFVQEDLKAGGIASLDALWREIGARQDHGGLADVVSETGVHRPALIQDLTSLAAAREEEKGRSWPRRHALDLLLIVFLIFLAWLFWRAVPKARSVGIAERDLIQGERLGASNVAGAGSEPLTDRQTRRAIDRGTYILPEWLKKISPAVGEEALRGRSRIAFRVQAADVANLSDLPALVSLVVSTRGGNGKRPASLWLRGVPVVAVEEDGDARSITVALKDSEIQDLLPLLPEDKVYVIQPVQGGAAARPGT